LTIALFSLEWAESVRRLGPAVMVQVVPIVEPEVAHSERNWLLLKQGTDAIDMISINMGADDEIEMALSRG
jgi:hypothetical protein